MNNIAFKHNKQAYVICDEGVSQDNIKRTLTVRRKTKNGREFVINMSFPWQRTRQEIIDEIVDQFEHSEYQDRQAAAYAQHYGY